MILLFYSFRQILRILLYLNQLFNLVTYSNKPLFTVYIGLNVLYIIQNIIITKSLLDRATNCYIISIGIAVSAKNCLIGQKAAG